MHTLPHDDVLLLILDVLERVGQRSDLPLDGCRLAVVGDVDDAVNIETFRAGFSRGQRPEVEKKEKAARREEMG